MSYQTHLEFGLRPMDGHVDMLVTHALQNSLMRNGIVLPGKSHIFFAQPREGR